MVSGGHTLPQQDQTMFLSCTQLLMRPSHLGSAHPPRRSPSVRDVTQSVAEVLTRAT